MPEKLQQSYKKQIRRNTYSKHTNLRKTKKKNICSAKRGADATLATSSSKQIQEEISRKLKAQFEVLGNETPINIDDIFLKLYEDLEPSTITKAGTKPSGSSSPKPITQNDNFINYCQSKYEHYEQLPHKTLVVACVHSWFYMDYIVVPDNVCLCFTTSLMEFGISGEDGLLYHNFYEQQLPEDFFEAIFNYKQLLIENKLQVQIEVDKKSLKINYFQNSNWYYPGQKCPMVGIYLDENDVEDEIQDIYEVTNVGGTYRKDNSKMRYRKLLKMDREYKLNEYLKIYNTNPKHQYIFIISGCRSLDLAEFKTVREDEIRNLKIKENITFRLNSELTESYLRQLKKSDKLQLETMRNTGITELEDILEYDCMNIPYSFFKNTNEIEDGEFTNYYMKNYQHQYQSSRKNKIYLDILQSIQSTGDINNEQVLYLIYGPIDKTLLFIINQIVKNKTLTEAQIKKVVRKIFDKIIPSGDLLRHAFELFSNFYVLLNKGSINLLNKKLFQSRFMDNFLFINQMYLDIINKFPPTEDSPYQSDRISYYPVFAHHSIFIDNEIDRKLPKAIKNSLASIHLINQTKSQGFDVLEYVKVTDLKFTENIEILEDFQHLVPTLKTLTLEKLNLTSDSEIIAFKQVELFQKLKNLTIEFTDIKLPEPVLTFSFTNLTKLDLLFLKISEPETNWVVNLSLPQLRELTLNYENLEEGRIIFINTIHNDLTLLKLTAPSLQHFMLPHFTAKKLKHLELSLLNLEIESMIETLEDIVSRCPNLKTLFINNNGTSSIDLDDQIFMKLLPISSISGLENVTFSGFTLDSEKMLEFLDKILFVIISR